MSFAIVTFTTQEIINTINSILALLETYYKALAEYKTEGNLDRIAETETEIERLYDTHDRFVAELKYRQVI